VLGEKSTQRKKKENLKVSWTNIELMNIEWAGDSKQCQ
jgi:hypothetical protein